MTDGPKKIIKDITNGFAEHGYICSEQIATAVYLASQLEKPIVFEGPLIFRVLEPEQFVFQALLQEKVYIDVSTFS